MSTFIQPSGIRFLLERIAGSDSRINGMYVEFGPPGREAGLRTPEYFENLIRTGNAGYARVPVTSATADPSDSSVCFTALVCREDFKGSLKRNSGLVAATLACFGSDEQGDTLVSTTGFSSPVRIVDGAYTTVHVKLRLWHKA